MRTRRMKTKADVDNLSRRQLSADAEIILGNNSRIESTAEDMLLDEHEPQFTTTTIDKPKPNTSVFEIKMSTRPANLAFIPGDLCPQFRTFPVCVYTQYNSLSCVEIFLTFFFLMNYWKKY